ncbi:MAG: VPLPA-CTERM sorting domain-containing protein [Methylococcaceae bacterium]|jgi:hypothetical protein
MKSIVRTLVIMLTVIWASTASASLIEAPEVDVYGPAFASTFGFSLSSTTTVDIEAENAFFTALGKSFNKITGFGASLLSDNGFSALFGAPSLTTTALPGGALTSTQTLSYIGSLLAGNYVLKVFGDAPFTGASFEVNALAVPVSGSSVPLPASFWLLGTALLGLVKFSRKSVSPR